ncbi:MAG: hypothetical protein XD36_0969 [Halomonas sp. 54_146]|nr:MAG: hypothetical protein XD36_0969 [Halomonas sp. 54_146]
MINIRQLTHFFALIKSTISVLRIFLVVCLLMLGASAFAFSGQGYSVCRLDPNGDNFLALRSGPGAEHPIIMRLPPDTVVEERGDSTNGWLPIVVERTPQHTYLRDLPSGYVWVDYLCPL